ncbi:DUF3800 domain-containing protein [Azospirillum sp. SYSU D00513]|uniref:DUF3800 domain-containing protein n=1 Tax=Azospirillum sp. SYSU D00513 TaxID=2812561 RepID=UPI001A95E2A6|nr:DUF3800 domain-containing protein [Azospirillum sp. SYSU D00513]
MTWLLFMDESGHDHKKMPAEVRGGVAIHASKIWPFMQAWHGLEQETFGVRLADHKTELKGYKLLDKDRFKWSAQAEELPDEERRKGVRRFFALSAEKKSPGRSDFTAYGQACIGMAVQILLLLKRFDAVVFASIIPRGVKPPADYAYDHFLRRDHVLLLERFFHFLSERRDHGLLVMDETDKAQDRRFVDRLQAYFTRTQTGRTRTEWIVPAPLFVSSDMSVGVQAADIVLYCINWGFRAPTWNFDGSTRPEIAENFSGILNDLQFKRQASRNGEPVPSHGIFFLPDPFY